MRKKIISNCSLTYIKDNSEQYMPFSLIDSHHLHLVLTPYPPMSLNDTGFMKYLSLSRSVGDISMLSILSAKSPAPMPTFRLMRIFTPDIWFLVILLYFILTTISYFLWSSDPANRDKHQTLFIDFVGIIWRQSIRSFNPHQKYARFVMLWYLAVFIFSSAFSGTMLSVLVMARVYYKIDSIGNV